MMQLVDFVTDYILSSPTGHDHRSGINKGTATFMIQTINTFTG
jgi:hypothetical protein